MQELTSQTAAATFGTDQVQFSGSATAPEQLTVTSVDAAGNKTATVYTALDSNGNVIDGSNFASDAKIATLSATTTITPATSTNASTTSTSTVSDAATVAELQSVTTNAVAIGSASYGNEAIAVTAGTASTAATIEIQSKDLYGNTTTTTYTAADANGTALVGTGSQAAAAEFTAVTTFTPASSTTTNLLTQDGIDVTGGTAATFQIGGANGYTAAGMLAAVTQALAAVPNYSAEIGATQDRMTAASTFNSDADDQLLERRLRPGRRGHEHSLDPAAGAADPGAARHPVAVDRQPERLADPQAVRRLTPNFPARRLPCPRQALQKARGGTPVKRNKKHPGPRSRRPGRREPTHFRQARRGPKAAATSELRARSKSLHGERRHFSMQ